MMKKRERKQKNKRGGSKVNCGEENEEDANDDSIKSGFCITPT